ncbi:MAG: hypothetical protein SGJ19_22235, partial [Planctomycetia bacterium]|nr:hypothetical protein [Planctomycetia bacterium]
MSFTVPYSRPTALSDPYFDHSEEVCQRILATPDGELDWSDFQAILGPFLPAGTYEEAVYFLPMAFDYCLSNERDGIEVITSVIWFSSQFADRLKHDRVVDAARNAITDILLQATRNFRVVHLDRDACAKQGWGLQYEDIVLLSRHVCCAVEDLTRFARHYDLADWLVGRLAYHRDDVVRAAWFLELARKLQD